MASVDAAGNRLFVTDDFEGAAAAYTKALKAGDTLTPADKERLYLCRCAVHLELREYKKAIADAQAASTLNSESFLALFREGVACFETKEFAQAVAALKRALRVASEEVKEECHRMLNRAQASLSVKTLEQQERAKATPAIPAPAALSQQQSQPQMPQARVPQAQSAAARPVRARVGKKLVHYSHSHYQTEKTLYIEIAAAGLTAEEVQHRFGPREIFVTIDRKSPSESYTFQIVPFAEIKAAKCKCTIKADKLLLKVFKVKPENWDEIFSRKSAADTDRGDFAASLPSAYSNPSKNWKEIGANVAKELADEDAARASTQHK